MDLEARARRHAALGDRHRLEIVDALELGDLMPSELQELTGLSSNLLAFHLGVLEAAGIVARRRSSGDGRRRYVTRLELAPAGAGPGPDTLPGHVLFVCTRNAARSQLAAALWRARTGARAGSAGTAPADRIHPHAVEVARRRGLDLGSGRPRGYEAVDVAPDLVVSVCDRARESELPFVAPHVHWSVHDPAGGDLSAFERTFDELRGRVERLARAVAA